MSVFERLYASEINFVLASSWDCGYVVRLGDSFNGLVDSATCKSMAEVEAWLTEAAPPALSREPVRPDSENLV